MSSDGDEEEGDEGDLRPGKANAGKRGRPMQKHHMVDITALLGMPQREAAEVLGISESMLCKRYKECTKRKWPFRRLSTLDKKIAAKEALLARMGILSRSDQLLLEGFIKEKETILVPIQIRVTDSLDGRSKRKASREEYDERVEAKEREKSLTEPLPAMKVQRGVFEGSDALNELDGSSFNPASVLLTLGGGL